MTTNDIFTPDDGPLFALSDAGGGPVLVLDPCGTRWKTFWTTSRWPPHWRAWRLAPGQTQEGDAWSVTGELDHVDRAAGAAAIAASLFPEARHALTRELMGCLLRFASETGHAGDFPSLAGQLWAGEPWDTIARWTRAYPDSPLLRTARSLLTEEGASEALLAIRYRMSIYHHPHVAETFAGEGQLQLSTLRQDPHQIIFLTPDIRCMESGELTSVYGFLVSALQSVAALHHVTLTLVEPPLNTEGDAS